MGADTEHSANSEGSHETGDSGRFSHESNDEIHLSSVISSPPLASHSFTGSDSGEVPSLQNGEDLAELVDAELSSSCAVQPLSSMLGFATDNFAA